jgi:hypothetical protein
MVNMWMVVKGSMQPTVQYNLLFQTRIQGSVLVAVVMAERNELKPKFRKRIRRRILSMS